MDYPPDIFSDLRNEIEFLAACFVGGLGLTFGVAIAVSLFPKTGSLSRNTFRTEKVPAATTAIAIAARPFEKMPRLGKVHDIIGLISVAAIRVHSQRTRFWARSA